MSFHQKLQTWFNCPDHKCSQVCWDMARVFKEFLKKHNIPVEKDGEGAILALAYFHEIPSGQIPNHNDFIKYLQQDKIQIHQSIRELHKRVWGT